MKKAITVRIDEDILNRLRNIVYWSHVLTLNNIVEKGIEGKIEEFEHYFPDYTKQRPSKLKVGRKIE